MKLRITEWRKKRELTVDALASKAGLSKSYLSELANGKKTVNARHLEALSKALNCSPLDLLDDSSVEPDIIEHIRKMQSLSADDRQAIIRHADSLARPSEQSD